MLVGKELVFEFDIPVALSLLLTRVQLEALPASAFYSNTTLRQVPRRDISGPRGRV